jgi:hypothetical protein
VRSEPKESKYAIYGGREFEKYQERFTWKAKNFIASNIKVSIKSISHYGFSACYPISVY